MKLTLYKYLFVILLLLPSLRVPLLAQARDSTNSNSHRSDSPVFKSYRAPRPRFVVDYSDPDAELWDTFMMLKKANAGDPIAQHELGISYLFGRGITPDTVKAAYWIHKAADQHLSTAEYNYGIMLDNGWGVKWNPFEAFKHIQYAAGRELPEAEFAYGLFLVDNLVVTRNTSQAYKWVKASADSGYAPAKEALKEFIKRKWNVDTDSAEASTASGKRDAHDESSASLSGASSQLVLLDFSHNQDTAKPPDQQTILRNALQEGNDSLKKRLMDRELAKVGKARDTLRRAADTIAIDTSIARMILEEAEEGSPEALALAGLWYAKGIGVPCDTIAAAVYDIRAMQFDSPEGAQMLWELIHSPSFFGALKARVDQDDPAAEYVWAVLYRLKFDYQLTDEEALKLLERSASHKFVPAEIEMGMCYAVGTWVHADKPKGLKIWEAAAEDGNIEAKIRVLSAVVTDGDADSDAIKQLYDYASNGSVLAQTALGYCYETGTGVAQNKADAVRFYRKAAQRGSQGAFAALKHLYDEFRPKDKEFRIQ